MAGSLKNSRRVNGRKGLNTIDECIAELQRYEMDVSWSVLPISIVVSVYSPYPAFGLGGGVATQLSGQSKALYRFVTVDQTSEDIETAIVDVLRGVVIEVRKAHMERKRALDRIESAKGIR